MRVFCIVLSGGNSTRLWPAFTKNHAKPFIKLEDSESLLEKTYKRASTVSAHVLTVTNREYYSMSLDALDTAGVRGSFLLEPFGRNTAPAIAMAAHKILQEHGADALLLVLPADHLVLNQEAFDAGVQKAISLAKSNFLVTFGIVPTSAETGYGYIKQGEVLGAGHRVAQFIEKPDLTQAEFLASSGHHLWNSGMFCFKAQTFLDELAVHSPSVSQSIAICWDAIKNDCANPALEIPADLFARVPDVSVDYAVMEKSNRVAVVSGDFGWNDIGSWNALKDLTEPDTNGNRVNGDAIFVDSRDVFVQSEERLVAAVGVSELIIVDTPDALLVAHPDSAQQVKEVVSQLKAREHESYRVHKTVSRPWGTYTVLEEGSRFKIKRIEVKPGASLSLQMHQHRSEHWVVVSGTARIVNGESETLVQANQSAYIPAGQRHRLENPGVLPCVMIEVQCGDYLGEDDIVRFEDHYGRQ